MIKNTEGKILKIKINDITIIPELENVFHMEYEVKERIKEDIRKNGFNKAHAIHIFKWNGKWALCDGHTRFAASKELELGYIWAQIHSFNSLNEARLYSMSEQFNRRNILDKDLMIQFETLQNEFHDGKKLTAEELSTRLHKSKRHIYKLAEIFHKSTKAQLESIRNGDASINQIYQEIKKNEALKKTASEIENLQNKEITEFNDAIIPQSEEIVEKNIENSVSKKIQQKTRELNNKEVELIKKGINLSIKEKELSKRLSDKEIVILGIKLALIEIAKGKSRKEILNIDFDDNFNAKNLSFTQEDLDLINA